MAQYRYCPPEIFPPVSCDLEVGAQGLRDSREQVVERRKVTRASERAAEEREHTQGPADKYIHLLFSTAFVQCACC